MSPEMFLKFFQNGLAPILTLTTLHFCLFWMESFKITHFNWLQMIYSKGFDFCKSVESVLATLLNNILFFLKWLILFLIIFYYCYYSCPNFPPSPPPPSTSYSLRQSPHHCSCPWVMSISSLATPFPILYFTSPWLFCNYQFVLLDPLRSSPILSLLSPIWQPSGN